MKKIILIVVVLITAFSCSRVPAGNVGIKVYLLGQSKGVDSEVLGVGRYWIGVNEELYIFPTFQQNETWTRDSGPEKTDESFTFQTIEGMSVNASLGLAYQLDATKVPVIFQKYRRGVAELTDVVIRNEVRDALNVVAAKFTVEQVYGKGKEELLQTVEKRVRDRFAPEGINIISLSYVSSLRLPDNVVTALNAKIQATQDAQKVENEVAKARAEAEIQIAKARGEREANGQRQATISPILIEWERLQIQKLAVEKWNGVFPTTSMGHESSIILAPK